jgi:wobble nucleotide-excising tRNase
MDKKKPFVNREVKTVEMPQGREMVRRNELSAIMKQVIDNINEISKYLMQDINNMFQRFVFPSSLRQQALETLLAEKGIILIKEIDDKAKEIYKEAEDKAKEIFKEKEREKQLNTIPPTGNSESVTTTESAKIHQVDFTKNNIE